MKKICICSLALFMIMANTMSYSQKNENVMEFTNKLGVTATLSLPYYVGVKLGKDLPESICEKAAYEMRFGDAGFVLKLQDDAYMIIPFRSVKEINLKNGRHEVGLNNGKSISGNLIGQIETEGKVYDLSAASNIRFSKLYKAETTRQKTAEKTPEKKWMLSSSKPNLPEFMISRPKFAFQYYDEYKETVGYNQYINKTGKFIKLTEAFIIKVDGQEMSTNLSDFTKVTLKNEQKPPAKIEITSPSNITTEGSLILRNETKESIALGFVAELSEMDGSLLVLITPNFSFIQQI